MISIKTLNTTPKPDHYLLFWSTLDTKAKTQAIVVCNYPQIMIVNVHFTLINYVGTLNKQVAVTAYSVYQRKVNVYHTFNTNDIKN